MIRKSHGEKSKLLKALEGPYVVPLQIRETEIGCYHNCSFGTNQIIKLISEVMKVFYLEESTKFFNAPLRMRECN